MPCLLKLPNAEVEFCVEEDSSKEKVQGDTKRGVVGIGEGTPFSLF